MLLLGTVGSRWEHLVGQTASGRQQVSRSKRQLAVSLEFQVARCRCGAERIRGQACPDCGARPARGEVDYASLRRRDALAELSKLHAQLLEVTDAPPDDAYFPDVTDAAADLISTLACRIAPAFRLALVTNQSGDLRDLVLRLHAARVGVMLWPRVRPYLPKRRLALATLDALSRAVSEYFAACQAPTMLEAQDHAARMQAALDAGADSRRMLVDIEEAGDHLDYSGMEAFMTSLLRAQLKRFGHSLAEVIEGAPALVALLGVEPAAELRLSYVLAAGAAEDLDHDQFIKTFHQALDYFRQKKAGLLALAADHAFLEALHDADITIANAVWQALATLERAQSNNQRVNAAATLMSDLVEGPGALIARSGLLLSGIKSQSFAKLATENATTHIDRVGADQTLSFLVAGADTTLRNAKSHNQLRLVGDQVVATSKRIVRTYSGVALVDGVLHALETVAAVLLAMRQVLAESGCDTTRVDLDAIGLDEYSIARIVIRELYAGDIDLALDGTTLRLQIDDAPDLNALALVAATGPFLLKADRFEVVQQTRTGPKRLSGPTALLREPLKTDETDRQLQMLRIMSDCHVDGHPGAGLAEHRAVIITLAVPVLTKDRLDIDDGRFLRKLIAHAHRIADNELEASLRKCMRRMSGDPVPTDVLEKFSGWAAVPLDWRL